MCMCQDEVLYHFAIFKTMLCQDIPLAINLHSRSVSISLSLSLSIFLSLYLSLYIYIYISLSLSLSLARSLSLSPSCCALFACHDDMIAVWTQWLGTSTPLTALHWNIVSLLHWGESAALGGKRMGRSVVQWSRILVRSCPPFRGSPLLYSGCPPRISASKMEIGTLQGIGDLHSAISCQISQKSPDPPLLLRGWTCLGGARQKGGTRVYLWGGKANASRQSTGKWQIDPILPIYRVYFGFPQAPHKKATINSWKILRGWGGVIWAAMTGGLRNGDLLISNSEDPYWNGVLGRGCDEAEISEEQRLLTEWGQGIQWMKALVRNSTGKAIQWRGFGHSVICWTLRYWNLLRPSPSQISPPTLRTDGKEKDEDHDQDSLTEGLLHIHGPLHVCS